MPEQPTTYITPELRAELGVERERRVSPPIALSDIRKWAIATYWPERPPRIYWDDGYARGTKWGGIIAPYDFNPFAWPVDDEGWARLMEVLKSQVKGDSADVPGSRGMNGGSRVRYHNPMRAGDVITSVSKLVDLKEALGKKTGLLLFTFTENRWTNQKGELVKVTVGTGIRY
ncbi:MAG: MaoC family dehydratase N-terminal domain-containing protein [Chloroflexi bacterium]|nr:MaoC family dehydratase N-terminal domain-containing protein [Chloroflexota bacterium]